MTDVVSVKFKGRGKTYFFDPNGVDCRGGQQVVVETSKGLELAECVQGPHTVNDDRIVPPLRPVIRVATADDLRIAELCKEREKEAFGICEEKIAAHGLDMKLVDVECNFEGNKILFFFISDGRVDFRELVKDLASIFRARIELRQIGVRDEAKMLGGLGICGRPFCCHSFLEDFEPVSTKMAKTQSLSLNPAKISGSCGRLMCCLRYEQDAYEELVKTVPKNGAFVQTPCGYGNVCQVNLLRQKVKVKLDGVDDAPKAFDAEEVATIPGGRPKPGESLPDILVIKPKEEEKEELAPIWSAPLEPVEEAPAEEVATQKEAVRKKSPKNRKRGKKPPQGKPAPEQAKKETSDAPQAKKVDGEAPQQKKKPSKNRRHSPSKPKDAQQKTTEQSGEVKKPQVKQTEQKKAPRSESQTPVPQNGEKPGAGAPKKKNNYHRYRGKPKNKAPGSSVPKGE